MTEAPPRRSSLGLILGLAVGVLLGGGLTYLGAVDIAAEMRLRGGGDIVEAEVLDTRIMSSRKVGTTHELLYSFTLPGDPQKYTLSDGTGRDELWTSVPEADWHTAEKSRKVSVRYLPENPWISRPVNSGAAPLGDPIAGLVLGLLILAPCLLGLFAVLRRRPAA